MPFILESQGAGGADGDTLSTFLAINADGLIAKGGDYSIEATVGKAEGTGSNTVPAHPHAPFTEDAFIRVVDE